MLVWEAVRRKPEQENPYAHSSKRPSVSAWDEALIEHDADWFACPEGHFWYSAAAREIGSPLFDKDQQVWTTPAHELAQRNRDEAAHFVQILEMAEDGSGVWRGEWLAEFPKYRTLSDADKVVWDAWLSRPETGAYLDQVIERCSQLAEKARNARGYAIFRDHEDLLCRLCIDWLRS